MLTSDGPQFVIYVLLRLFHIFVKIIADKNHGNTDLVFSILRDTSHNSWIEFYKKHLHYIKLYTDELSKTNEFKISEEHIIKERKCIITIEYSYPDSSEITGSKEVQLLNTNQNGTTTFGIFKNAVHYIFGNPRRPPPQEIDEPTTSTKTISLFEQFEKDMESLKFSQPELTSDSRQDDTVNILGEEFLQVADEVSDIQERTRQIQAELENKKDELEGRNSILYTPLEEDVDTENEDFIEKLEELKKRNEEELKRKRQEREEKQRKLNEELREIRRLQKQKFAVLLQCIQLRYRFEEKEAEWSDWIEHCYRRLIVTVITQFADFQEELGVSEKAFRKTLKVSPETVQSEVMNLCQKMEATLHELSRIFKKLGQIDENFEDALFIRILQKSFCDISSKLISVLNCLDAIEYSIEWYQELMSKFGHIQTSDVPGVAELKRLCKEDNWEGLRNLEFPSWELRNHVKIEELSSDEDEDVVEDKPEMLTEVEKVEVGDTKSISIFDTILNDLEHSKSPQTEATSDSSQDETRNFLDEEIQQMTHGISAIQEQTRKTATSLQAGRNELEKGGSVPYAPLEEHQDPAQESGTETTDNYDKDSSDEDEDFQKQLEEQKRAHQLELEEKQQQRIDKRAKFQKERKKESRLFLEKLNVREIGSNSQ